MVLKDELNISDEDLTVQVENMRIAYEKELAMANLKTERTGESSMYPSIRPTTATTSVYTSHDTEQSYRRPSGLGFIRLKTMKTHDTLPSRSPLGRGRKMNCADLDDLIRVYVYLPQSGDSFYIWVPYNMPVGPPELKLDRFTELWGFDADARGPCSGKSDSVWERRRRRKSFKEEICEITGISINEQQISAYGAVLKINSVGINFYNVSHGSTVTLSKHENYEDRKAAKATAGGGTEPILAVTLAKRVKGDSGNATSKGMDVSMSALVSAAKRLNKTGSGYWIMPKWKHDEYPGLISKKLMRRFGVLSSDTIFYEDYMSKGSLIPGMGHGDPFGAIRKSFERDNVVVDLPQPSSPAFTHMGIIRSGFETLYNNHHRVTDAQRQKGVQTLADWHELRLNPQGPLPMTLERSRKLSLSRFNLQPPQFLQPEHAPMSK
ncbi:hypothetical protein FOL47_006564 [Perkinsus chesapeaki]|uniref:Uncharacterized protein n=1 Tax=Perkinsus chesapeaki TaxID=330153 RepID=A0A7J6LQW1_PERCH|nr:hypothetical protein FOL47_006564 [Perkinsus chesapeaki]